MVETINENWQIMMVESMGALITSVGVLALAVVLMIFLVRLITGNALVIMATLLGGVVSLLVCALMWGAGAMSPMKELEQEKEDYKKQVIIPYLEKKHRKVVKLESYKVVGPENTIFGEPEYPVEAVYRNEDGMMMEEKRYMSLVQNGSVERPVMVYIELEERIGPYTPGKTMYRIEYPNNEQMEERGGKE